MDNISQFLVDELPGAMRQAPGDQVEEEATPDVRIDAARLFVRATLLASSDAFEVLPNSDPGNGVLDGLVESGMRHWAYYSTIDCWDIIGGSGSRPFSHISRPGAVDAGLKFLYFAGLAKVPYGQSTRHHALLAGLAFAGLSEGAALSLDQQAGVHAAREELSYNDGTRAELLIDESLALHQTAGAAHMLARSVDLAIAATPRGQSLQDKFTSCLANQALGAWCYVSRYLTDTVCAAYNDSSSGSSAPEDPALNALVNVMYRTNLMGAIT